MTSVKISASAQYDVIIGSGLLGQAGEYLAPFCKNGRAAVITDDIVDSLYYPALEKSLASSGISAEKFVIENGEKSKNAENFINILEFLAEKRFTRTDVVIALGGGVVGDITGFAASAFLRGVSFVQIPTTLLAMVDSSVGGKTAIDLRGGKNLAGSFYQPRLVLCDHDTLATLDDSVFTDGCAEVIKYGVLGSEELFAHLCEKGKSFDREWVISTCVGMKRDIVNEDEFDNGMRQLLNLGHTIGHAIELCSGYTIPHGRAVAAGMAMIARGAEKTGICLAKCREQIEQINEKFGLPTACEYSADELYDGMLADKKRRGGTITLVMPERIGKCRLQETAVQELRGLLQ